jgi:hypothetical protein
MKWIDIKEQQPEKDKEVLIFDSGLFAVSHWDGEIYKGKLCFPDYQDEQPGVYLPSHWMPLPPSPIFHIKKRGKMPVTL